MTESPDTVFHVKSWDEQTVHDLSGGAKITRASVRQEYAGELQGLGTVEYLMAHRADGTAVFVGVENFGGSFRGKTGSFVVRHDGTYGGGVARSQWTVVEGSGTADLTGIAGGGSFEAGHGGRADVRLQLSLHRNPAR